MSSRRLSLHVSALNDEEYKLYNDALSDLALDSTNTSVGVREVRAWMRGKFDSLESADVDTVGSKHNTMCAERLMSSMYVSRS